MWLKTWDEPVALAWHVAETPSPLTPPQGCQGQTSVTAVMTELSGCYGSPLFMYFQFIRKLLQVYIHKLQLIKNLMTTLQLPPLPPKKNTCNYFCSQ